jgi:ubiquinone/menaquinone biosynthesis C-methylase UbiE
MPTEKEVYEKHADQYERLIRCEDYQNNILPVVERLCPLTDLDIVELGAGTGRLTRLLAPRVRSIQAFDAAGPMLKLAEASLCDLGLSNWQLSVADHRFLPVSDGCADLVISGWSFCYLAVWGGLEWRHALETGLAEMKRILRPGGSIILFETMGTGHETPQPPRHLSGYYEWLMDVGFHSTWIRTDYRFETLEEAGQISSFFFGKEMGQMVIEKKWLVLPECTGVWWTTYWPVKQGKVVF